MVRKQRRPKAEIRRMSESAEGETVIEVLWPMGGRTDIRLRDGVTPDVRLTGCAARMRGAAVPTLERIAARLDGREWDSDALSDVADILRAAGLVVRDVDDAGEVAHG